MERRRPPKALGPAARPPGPDPGPAGADMADLPGGASGMLVRDSKGKEADRLVTRIDPGVVSLVADLRTRCQQRLLAEHGETQVVAKALGTLAMDLERS
jgi:hypothetical protein